MTMTKQRALTPKQERFALFLFQGLSQRDAYVKAGYSGNQIPNTIDRHSYELANSDYIKARLSELQAKALDASVASVIERKQTLSKVVRCTYADFTDEKGNLNIADREQLRTPAIQEIRSSTTRSGTELSLKLRDPIAAIAELNKMERIGQVDTAININNDNRVLNITVRTEDGKQALQQLQSGKLPGLK